MWFLAIIIVVFLIVIYKDEIYPSFDHKKWNEYSQPSYDAEITDIDHEIVGIKNWTKVKTTVSFSDGFVFISFDSDIDNHFLYNTVSLKMGTKAMILEKAKAAHTEAVKKKLKT